jgi:anti-sigma factor RsiW
MKQDAHIRAQESIVGGAARANDERWLQEHLAGCPRCAGLLDRAHAVRSALRSVAVTADPAMVEAAQKRLLRHALELSERESRRWMLTASVAVAALFAWISVPLLWQAATWLGNLTAAPEAATILVFLMAALTPAVLGAAAALGLRGTQHAVDLERIRR